MQNLRKYKKKDPPSGIPGSGIPGSGIRDPATRHQKEIFFLNIVSKEERILPTKSGQAFEAMTILSKAKAFAVIAQK